MTTKELKSRAKNALKQGSYWTGYGVNISYAFINNIVNTIIGLIFSFGMVSSILSLSLNLFGKIEDSSYISPESALSILIQVMNQMKSIFIISLLVSFLSLVIKLLLSNVLQTGKMLWFSRNREQTQPAKFSLFFHGIEKGKYGNLVTGTAWRDLWMFIWKSPTYLASVGIVILCFVAIGDVLEVISNNFGAYNLETLILRELTPILISILAVLVVAAIVAIIFQIISYVKFYSYRAVDWILADNPNIGYRRALNLSKEMTNGFKGKWFVLDLSFIGWFLLLLLTFPVIFFTAPLLETYTAATHAEFYAMLRDEAVRKGLVTMEELGFVPVRQTGFEEPISATDFYQQQPQQPQSQYAAPQQPQSPQQDQRYQTPHIEEEPTDDQKKDNQGPNN